MADDRPTDPPRAWETLDRDPPTDYAIFSVHWETRRSPRTGDEHRIVVVEPPDSVNVIAITTDRKVVMVEQFRHGTRAVCLEIPAGLVDPGEDPAVAARRELLEETGYGGAADLTSLGWCHPNPAYMTNRGHTFLIEGVHRMREPQLDEGEDIRVRLVDEGRIEALVVEGGITNSLILVGLSRYLLSR